MGLESGTWVDDLVVTNPPSTDDKRQGDDHLRLIKSVLKNSFKRTTGRPVFFPTSVVKSAAYSILDTDENTIFRVDTSAGAFNLTLPNTLTTTNSGWKIYVVKTNVENLPVFIVPATGSIEGFSKIRRTQQFKMTEIVWTGNEFVASRPHGHVVGEVIEFYGAVLPLGFLWADGTTFVAADFVELNSVLGTNVKPDCRGRVSAGRDALGGTDAGRLGVVMSTDLLQQGGGTETVTLAITNMPAHAHTINDLGHAHNLGGSTQASGFNHRHGWGSNSDIDTPGLFLSNLNSQAGYNLDHQHTYDQPSGTFGGTAGGLEGGNINQGTGVTGFNSSLGYSLDHQHYTQCGGTTGTGTVDHTHILSGAGAQAVITTTNITINNNGSGTPTSVLQPTILCNKIMVAE